jgi:hypothetical protein
MSSLNSALRLAALDRHRVRLFGDAALKVFTTTPADGEAEAGEFTKHWSAQRTQPLTDDANKGAEAGHWQFQIAAASDWETTQTFMNSIVAVKVGTRRWRVKKVEKPIGLSLVWKIRAEIQ